MGDITWAPYLEKMREQIDQLKPNELKEWEGHDLAPAVEFKTAQVQGGFNVSTTEKLEKIALGTIHRNDLTHCGFCTIFPKGDYDLPIFISQWQEGEKEIKFLVDIMPTVDSLIDEEYRKKYIESVQPLWDRYASLPGICPEESDAIRSLCSIIYTAARVPIDKEGMRLAALAPHTEYLKSYLAFLPEVTSLGDESRQKEVKRKKDAIVNTLRTKFFQEVMKDSLGGAIDGDLLKLVTITLF